MAEREGPKGGIGQARSILVVINMFRFSTVHIAGLPFPSRKRQARNMKPGLKAIMESKHIYDMGYIKHKGP